ncbi:hypothetical protein Poli38472_011824 [Pythium oligandrum]|uniref:Uncharacterized protein n=1 Tax=Pythium oligandrum TaxID=41045 RepID=A0A8K1C7S7_PYTOL|nr:hypothetical protein Poli38472_011824 [Pythium oligandrum]|eukprot:TMW58236.1 hypothetical protein Poli38472_011824 [Pythium oligandrum]
MVLGRVARRAVALDRARYASPPAMRRFVQTNATKETLNPAAAASNGAAGAEDEAPKYKPGFFSRNPGVTLGGIVLAIALYVYRSSKSKKNFEAVQLPIADAAVISPYEAWELRSNNEITPETFETLRTGVFDAFPSGKAAMAQFDRYLGFKLRDACPNGIHMAHHLERVLMSLAKDEEQKNDVDALMVAFSMTVKGATDDRLKCLFDLAARANAGHAEEEEKTITQPEFERLLDLLLQTYQIPSEKRVVPVEAEKYPFQQFKPATAFDLLQGAAQAQVDAKLITSEEANARDAYTFEAFSQIMKGKVVCLWGECFANSKKRMKS